MCFSFESGSDVASVGIRKSVLRRDAFMPFTERPDVFSGRTMCLGLDDISFRSCAGEFMTGSIFVSVLRYARGVKAIWAWEAGSMEEVKKR
jgi:hypothetical protein